MSANSAINAVVGQPEVVEDLVSSAAWTSVKSAVLALRRLQTPDGSLADSAGLSAATAATAAVQAIIHGIREIGTALPADAAYHAALVADLERWVRDGFPVPDFHDSLVAFRPELNRVHGLRHLVVFPMYTQNGSTERLFEAVLIEVIWPDFVAELEAGEHGNALFVPIRFLDFTPGYDTNSAVLFPETVSLAGRALPPFTWGAIFADREAARFRRVVREAAAVTRLELPPDAQRLLGDQALTEETFVMWDLIHDRTHMRGDLPFDPFMIKQRMPYFLYSLEELRCDLTAYREADRLEHRLAATPESERRAEDNTVLDRARLVKYAVLFDRIFRFAITGTRVRNYDGLGGQLLFAWLHQRRVLHWTDTRLSIDWTEVPEAVLALGAAIDELYWRSIDRPKVAHWLAAYALVSGTLTPHPASRWATRDLPLSGTPKEMTDAVLEDEFPLSMFYEALSKKMVDVIASTAGITGRS